MSQTSTQGIFRQKKVCVLIPTYNNARTFEAVVKGVLGFTDQVVVVNDGSTDATAEMISRYPQVNVVSYGKNQGKGYALRQGFKRALELGYEYAISIDSDGQHYPDDLPLFLAKLEHHPSAIIIGARNMEQASVPGKSSFGNKFSNFWFRVETGLKMNDTQSGYRLYPVMLLNKISFITRKFEFEIEVIVRSAWNGIEVVEVPVRVFYPEKAKRISHFLPFRDFTRISVLNTFLVTIAFLFIKPRDFFRSIKKKNFTEVLREHIFNPHESDWIKAISVGFGIFMGIVPIWGFQLIVGMSLAFFFRLNKALVFIAANISIPPMIPVILFLSHLTGAFWMGENAQYISFSSEITLKTVANNFVQYLLGATTLAVVAGVISTGLVFVMIKIFKKFKPTAHVQ